MKTVNFRIKPTTRFVITRFHSETQPDGRGSGGCETLGEFDHLYHAETVARALHHSEAGSTYEGIVKADTHYVIVQRGFDIETRAFYAESGDEALRLKAEAEDNYPGTEFRVFSRARDPEPVG